MRIHRRDDHWLWVGGPVPPGSAAITIGPVISVRSRAAGSVVLLRHELVHVDQWREQGPFGFLTSYLGAYLRCRLDLFPHLAAYRRIPQEIEARWLSRMRSAVDMSHVAATLQ